MTVVVMRPWDDHQGADPVLAYDPETEELWGYEDYWEAHLDKVGLSEREFMHFFDSHRLFSGTVDGDPFEDTPNAEELLRNYPPGSEEIPDVPTMRPPQSVTNQEASEKAADSVLDALGDSGN